MEPRPILLSWSSGKDSAFCLQRLREDPSVRVEGLLTTVNATHERVAMHAVRRALLAEQGEVTGIPVWEVEIPSPCSNEDYARAMTAVVERAVGEGIQAVAFGDLFLEDIRAYREEQLARTSLEALFPLWGEPTPALATAMLDAGLTAWVTCVDPRQVPAELCGRPWDAAFLAALPPGADPCGENGEFHTFVTDGPMFSRPIPVTPGEVVERDGFVYADLLPGRGPG